MTTQLTSRDLKDIRRTIKRRIRSFLALFGIGFILSVIIAFSLPTIYRSESTILIEDQQIPADYVKTTITSYVEQRLQSITQQIMSRTKLTNIIRTYGLYPEMQRLFTTEEIIEKMRSDIGLETINTEVIDKRTGRSMEATIAFKLAYMGKDPATVQRVANVLASLYLEENLKAREERASTTTLFLEKELDAAKQNVDALQDEISQFKHAHLDELPEYSALNMQAIARLERDVDQLTLQIRSLQERKIYLEGQISGVEPLSPIQTEDGRLVMNPSDQLKYLRLKLVMLQGTCSEKHPDILAVKKQIRELEAQTEASDDSLEKVRRMEDLSAKLADAKARLGEKHPDVVALSGQLESLASDVSVSSAREAGDRMAEARPDNPAYINLNTQIASTELQIQSLKEEEARIEKAIEEYEEKLRNAPLLEKEYNNLLGDYQNARQQYNEIMAKLMEARVSQGMEESQRGERFTIIDPAAFPEKPYKPNRIAILVIGFLLSLGTGLGAGFVLENLDTSVKTDDELKNLTGRPVLAVVPFMESRKEIRSRRMRRLLWIAGALAMAGVILFVAHTFFIPLDILWIKIERFVRKGM